MSAQDPGLAAKSFSAGTALPHVSARRAWTVLGIVVASHAVVFLDKALLGLTAQPLMRELGLSKAEFGSISGASYLLFGVTCLIAGYVADRFSVRWVLLACGVMWALGQIPAIFAVSGAMLYLSRVAVGAAEGPAQPLSHVAAYSWFPNERRGLPAALITCGTSIGKFALVPLVALIIAQFGWHAAFVTVGLLALVWSGLWLVWGRLGPYGDTSTTAGGSEPAVSWWRIVLSGTFIGSFAAVFTQGALAAVIFTWLPSYFHEGLGFSITTAGTLFTVPSAMAIVSLLCVGPITDRLLRKGVPSRLARGVFGGCCLIASGLMLMLLYWVSSPVLAIVVLTLGYGLSTTVNVIANPSLAEITPVAKRARALSALVALGSLAGVTSPIFTGWLLDIADTQQRGYAEVFLVFGALVALGGLCFAVLVHPERDRRRVMG
ncbi:MFS transporter [Nonomuraea sp. NPDC052129]|uniref:MFS transporter n=1 Tax=Nonomuraea sp. NPDC052129 TaxID=3154651 RepID=UPI003440C398